MHDIGEDERSHGAIAAAISTAAVRIVREYTGRGPTKASTVVNRNSVMVLMADTMTKAERMLIASSKAAMVLNIKQEFQRAMRDDLIAAVEMNMERRVIAFMSDNHVEPDMAVEVFVLEPLAEDREGSDQASA